MKLWNKRRLGKIKSFKKNDIFKIDPKMDASMVEDTLFQLNNVYENGIEIQIGKRILYLTRLECIQIFLILSKMYTDGYSYEDAM